MRPWWRISQTTVVDLSDDLQHRAVYKYLLIYSSYLHARCTHSIQDLLYSGRPLSKSRQAIAALYESSYGGGEGFFLSAYLRTWKKSILNDLPLTTRSYDAFESVNKDQDVEFMPHVSAKSRPFGSS